MHSGFSTDEFLEFSKVNVKDYVESNFLELSNSINKLPYHLVNRMVLNTECKFLITPICLSGNQNIDFKFELEKGNLSYLSISGGFIQSRDTRPINLKKNLFGKYLVLFEYRSNYRISLDIDDQDYISTMKTDSRHRVKKLISKPNKYNLVKYNGEENYLNSFNRMYNEIAKKNSFKDNYLFSIQKWKNLLKSDFWDMYLLFYDNEIIACSIICKLEKGFDYTFMAYNNHYKDAARAIVFFTRKELAKKYNTFLDLGGGISEGDSLSRFKISMGGKKVNFTQCKFVNSKLFKNYENGFKNLENRWP